MRTLSQILVPVVLASVAGAQDVDLTNKAADRAIRYTIESSATVNTERAMLIDGEEPDFGGRGMGNFGGETKSSQKIVLEESPEGWRHYHSLQESTTRPGRDGEAVESTTDGGLAGKRVTFSRDEDGGLILHEGEGDEKKDLPGSLGRGVPRTIDLNQMLPGKAVAVGAEFDLGDSFRDALAGFFHPVTPARDGVGRGANRDRGERGERGDRPERGQGGRGNWRRGRFGSNSSFQVLTSDAMDTQGSATVKSLEDGIATIEIKATISGSGEAEDFGIQTFGGFGRRGGGDGGGDNGSTIIDAKIVVNGHARYDVATGMITAFEVEGSLDYKSDMLRTMNFGGEEREMEMSTATAGSFAMSVACEAAEQG